MSTTDNAPDSHRDGGEKSYEDLIDLERSMVYLPKHWIEWADGTAPVLSFRTIEAMRKLLQDWLIDYAESNGMCKKSEDINLFQLTDSLLSTLQHAIILKTASHNNSTDSKQ